MVVYVTGASSGIGKAICEMFLTKKVSVIGISRTQSIEDLNYTHRFVDLACIDEIKKFNFSKHNGQNVVLINNAGLIKPIKPVGHLEDDNISTITTVNLLAPQILTNKFMKLYLNYNQRYHILNISSGAGKHPIDAWATYCASKAGIDLFSETIKLECSNRKLNNWHIHAFAPGVVDTQMQEDIRNSNPKDFRSHQNFIKLKKNNELIKPDLVAKYVLDIIENPDQYSKVVFSIRDLI
jgi:benzil reductase ((S)-benzoin forming)